MKGLSERAVKAVEGLIKNKFDSISLKILGLIPKPTKEKRIVFKTTKTNLISLFLQALGTRDPNKLEEDTLKTMLRVATGYIDALRDRTTSRVINEVDAFVKDASLRNKPVSMNQINSMIEKEMDKAGKHLKMISNAESNKAINTGTALQISKIAEEKGEEDPVVFFVVFRDEKNHPDTLRLHLLPDGITPRVWKLSELNTGYHTTGGPVPSVLGTHGYCFTGQQKIYTDEGIFTFKELYKSKKPLNVMVDRRIVNKKTTGNQFGQDIPGQVRLDPHKNYGEARFLPSTPVFDTGIQDVIRIKLKNGLEQEVTLNHECWVKIGNSKWGKKQAKDLKEGDRLPLAAYSECFGKDHFPLEAELMGNLLGDGVFNEKTNSCVWNFFGNDIEYSNELIKKRNLLYEKYNNTNHNGKEIKTHSPNDKYNVEQKQIASVFLGRIFKEEFGFTKKPRRVPKRLFTADKETVSAFLRGLYAADGHSEKPSSVVLAQNDYVFLQEIQTLISMFGLVSSIYEHGKKHDAIIKYANGEEFKTTRKACWRLCMGGWDQCKKFIDDIGFGVTKKQENAIKFLLNATHNESISNWTTSTIVSIEHIGKQQTYCLTEPMTNTVTVNGIVTGQCRCKLTYLSKSFGFDEKGLVKFKGLDWNEFEYQRANYEMPKDLRKDKDKEP